MPYCPCQHCGKLTMKNEKPSARKHTCPECYQNRYERKKLEKIGPIKKLFN